MNNIAKIIKTNGVFILSSIVLAGMISVVANQPKQAQNSQAINTEVTDPIANINTPTTTNDVSLTPTVEMPVKKNIITTNKTITQTKPTIQRTKTTHQRNDENETGRDD